MDIGTLQKWRLVVPGTMFLLLVAPLSQEQFGWQAFTNSLTIVDTLFRSVAAIVCGALYYISDFRTYVLRGSYYEIRENIKNRLLEPCLVDPQIAGAEKYLREGRPLIDTVFYHFVDHDDSLKQKAKRVYFNGLIWSSVADFIAVSTIGVLLYWSAVIFYTPRLHFIVIAAALALLQVPAEQWALSRLTRKHIALQNEQLDYIRDVHRARLCDRILGLLPR